MFSWKIVGLLVQLVSTLLFMISCVQGLTLNKKLFKPKCQNEKNIIQNITQNQRGKNVISNISQSQNAIFFLYNLKSKCEFLLFKRILV